VVIITGGGSGHEPAHAGFIGEGLVTASVCGGVFASPSSQAVLDTLRTVCGPAGCLLVVKNYTGDRINFGVAAEQAKSEGHNVAMVIVGEDVAGGWLFCSSWDFCTFVSVPNRVNLHNFWLVANVYKVY